jgi:GTPase SAR1 family protein
LIHCLVYDVSNRDTFDALQNWYTELQTYSSSKDVVKMIVGNKVDKVRRYITPLVYVKDMRAHIEFSLSCAAHVLPRNLQGS